MGRVIELIDRIERPYQPQARTLKKGLMTAIVGLGGLLGLYVSLGATSVSSLSSVVGASSIVLIGLYVVLFLYYVWEFVRYELIPNRAPP